MIQGNVVLLPALLVGVAYLLVAWRQGLRPSTVGFGLVAIAHLTAVVALTLFPLPVQREVIEEGRMLQLADNNFVPIVNTVDAIADGRHAAVLRLALGNVLALAPLGIYGPFLWPRMRTWPGALAAGIGASIGVETAQLLISTALGYTYRIADVDDILFNAAGVLAGYAGYRLLVHRHANGRKAFAG